MSESSLIKIQVLGTAALLKKDSNTRFSCEFCEFSNNTCFVNDLWTAGTETPFVTEHLQWLYLADSGFQPAILLKKKLGKWRLSVNFAKFLRISFDRTRPDDWFLCLSVNFEKFFRTPLCGAPMKNCYFIYKLRIWTITYRKNYFPSAFQAFYTRRSSYSKALMYLKSLKIICKEANL